MPSDKRRRNKWNGVWGFRRSGSSSTDQAREVSGPLSHRDDNLEIVGGQTNEGREDLPWSNSSSKRDLYTEINHLLARLNRSEQQLADKDDRIRRLTAQVWDDKGKFDRELASMRRELGDSTARLKMEHRQEKATLIEDHRVRLRQENERLAKEHADNVQQQLERLTKEHSAMMQSQHRELTESYQTALESQRDEATYCLETTLSAHKEELRLLGEHREQTQREHDARIALVREEKRQLEQAHVDKVASLERSHADTISELESRRKESERAQEVKHQHHTKSLRASVHDLNDALLASDEDKYTGSIFSISTFPRSPDSQIRDQFLEVQQAVEDLGRMTWRHDREIWTEDLIGKVGKQTGSRLVKKAFVQDTIWTILDRLVFSSPYHMFGEEGLKLEEEWYEQCQSGHHGVSPSSGGQMQPWPVASIKAERWRYMTMSQCREILSKPKPSEYDKRASVQQGFKSSLNRLVTDLRTALAEIAELSSAEMKLIQRVSTKATQVWLDFCLHRCRIIIRCAAPDFKVLGTAEKIDVVHNGGTLKLLVVPEVGRYGNNKGAELETFTVIQGCRGEVLELPE